MKINGLKIPINMQNTKFYKNFDKFLILQKIFSWFFTIFKTGKNRLFSIFIGIWDSAKMTKNGQKWGIFDGQKRGQKHVFLALF